MNEQPYASAPKKDHTRLVFGVVVLVAAAAIAWLVYRVENLADKQADLAAKVAQSQQAAKDDIVGDGWSTRVKSGNGGFELTLPDGWGSTINVKKDDFVIKAGTKQPDLGKGKPVRVVDVDGYGTDSPSLFSAVLLDKGKASPARGEVSEFKVGKAEDEIIGKKYSYIYAKDDIAGIGKLRPQGDRDYEYVLPTGDKELHVYYSVYGSDPRNLIETVDEIVRTVTLAKQSPADL